MPTDYILIACLLAVSAAATLFAWSRIFRSADPIAFKICLAFIAAIPLLGPVFLLFVASMPASRLRQSDLLFRGPVGSTPARPLGAASSYKALFWIAAIGVLMLHGMPLVAVLK